MSGLIEKQHKDTVFLVVKDYSLCEESKTEREGFQAVERKNPRTGQTVTKHVRYFEAVEGFVNKIEWYDTGEQYEQRYCGYKIHIDALGTPVVLDLPIKSRPYDVLMKVAANVEWEKPVKFSAWHDRKEDTTAFVIRQNDQVVKRAYTKDHPNGCPQAERTEDETGKETWDFRKQRIWLKKEFDNGVIPAVAKAAERRIKTAEPVQSMAKAAAVGSKRASEPDDPFGDFDDYNSSEIPF